ncbi:hypothetical protein H5410_031229 [Solanum commersonii]|uniref:Endonuclease/exonuclease/phosphatase domain-containing protein n=1 Tax=Solanum commersonii TaxID=4109 RepID=A0A9J5YGJ2_SOLCO|nr:hypothetical protein H5410_031229 [Solanum commersonii]
MGQQEVEITQLEARGTKGGIIILWDSSIWEGEVCEVGAYCITVRFLGKTQDFSWHLSGVYAPNNREEREEVWWELGAVRSLFNGPWVIAGDFNVIRFPSKKKNCTTTTKAMEDFSDFIEDMELEDPPLTGGTFTWRKADKHDIAARLDRFLFSEEWEISSKKIKQTIMPRITSDHNPLLLECGNWRGHYPILNSKIGGCKLRNSMKVKGWWNSESYTRRPDYILVCKLKALKVKLKEWSITVQGNLDLQKQSILNQLSDFVVTQDQICLFDDESFLRVVLTVELEEVEKREEAAWRQRERDRNAKFFHRTANCHKRYNNIDSFLINGAIVSEPAVITDQGGDHRFLPKPL